jgi:hypothetical protein
MHIIEENEKAEEEMSFEDECEENPFDGDTP